MAGMSRKDGKLILVLRDHSQSVGVLQEKYVLRFLSLSSHIESK